MFEDVFGECEMMDIKEDMVDFWLRFLVFLELDVDFEGCFVIGLGCKGLGFFWSLLLSDLMGGMDIVNG